jgi:acetyltransferase-like isoleucine patch superfamily enzyme
MPRDSSKKGLADILLQRLYQWAKRDSSYEFQGTLPASVLLSEVTKRGAMACRGWLLAAFSRCQTSGTTFVGRNVRIRNARSLILGRSVSIHDHVYIDALSQKGVSIGNNVTIREHTIIECTGVLRYPGEGITIGDDVGISQYCFIGARGFIHIGNDVQIGPRVTIYSEDHNFEDTDRLIRGQGVRRSGIIIGSDCWLGAGSTILDGATVGQGSVVAAGCVVTKSVPPYSVVAGIPGRVIRKRGAR